MLSAKKVKLHGMRDSRWTINDKLTQYSGLINLCYRDNKILQNDLISKKKNNANLIHHLSRNMINARKEMENAVAGDKQNLRNILQEHKDLLLAFNRLTPEKSAENVHQTNFTKRKELDRLKFQMKSKKETLINHKLKLANLEDCTTYTNIYGKRPIEEQVQVVTGKVQDALLKQEAAITVRYTYKEILNLLKNDSHYYDAVLSALSLDLSQQGICLRRITELGQLATENLDDRRYELEIVRNAFKFQEKQMKSTIDAIKSQVKDVTNNVKTLIRRDSDINICKKDIIRSADNEALINDVNQFEIILTQLQNIIMVPNYDSLHPCLIKQRSHQQNFSKLVENMLRDYEKLTTKKTHAEMKLNSLYYSMIDTTLEYMNKKRELNEQIKRKKDECMEIKNKITNKGRLAIKIRASLQQISDMLNSAQTDAKRKLTLSEPEIIKECNEVKLLAEISSKIKLLSPLVQTELTKKVKESAHICFMDMITNTCNMIKITEEVSIDDLLEGFAFEDANIFTRADIKKQSQQIVERNLELEHEMFMTLPPKKKR